MACSDNTLRDYCRTLADRLDRHPTTSIGQEDIHLFTAGEISAVVKRLRELTGAPSAERSRAPIYGDNRPSHSSSRQPTCRDCGAPIVFLEARNGKRVPVDPETAEPGEEFFDKSKGHRLHFVRCGKGSNQRGCSPAKPEARPVSEPPPF